MRSKAGQARADDSLVGSRLSGDSSMQRGLKGGSDGDGVIEGDDGKGEDNRRDADLSVSGSGSRFMPASSKPSSPWPLHRHGISGGGASSDEGMESIGGMI